MTIVLDGGLSNALEARGHHLGDDLWTARLLRDAPQEIVAVHRAYFDAGAEVATTASYQASVDGFVAAGIDGTEAQMLIKRSVELAREATDGVPGRVVAASVGPYGAVLGDGSEYRGNYGLTIGQLRDFHRPRVELLMSAGPDLLAVETIPDVVEAEAIADLLDEYGFRAWLSFTVAGGRTRAGQELRDAFCIAEGIDSIELAGVNCCAPGDVLDAIGIASEVSGKPAVAYPNAGQEWDGENHRWLGRGSYDVALVGDWLKAGVTHVGGCCQVGPSAIEGIAKQVADYDSGNVQP